MQYKRLLISVLLLGTVVILSLILAWFPSPLTQSVDSSHAVSLEHGDGRPRSPIIRQGSLKRTDYLIRLSRTCTAAAEYEYALNSARLLVKRSGAEARQMPLYRGYLLIAGIYRDWGRLDEMDIYVRLALDALNADQAIKPDQRKRVWRQLQRMLRGKRGGAAGVIEREA